MNHKTRSERRLEALAAVLQHWETRRKVEARPPANSYLSRAFTIASSRESGARGTSTAREVGARLGWMVYDQELVEQIAQEMKLRTSLLKSIDEKRVSWLEECVEAFASGPSVSGSAYVRHLTETLFSLATHGDCVIVGRGTAQILPVETTLRVRLVAPVEWRVVAMSQKLAIPREEAARQVEKIDRERVGFVKDYFHKDATDPRQYDLVLNASRLSVNGCADLIVETLHHFQAHPALVTSTPVAHAKSS
jgi:cytidylate kinase